MTATKYTALKAASLIRQRVLLNLARAHGVKPSKIEERMARPSPKYNGLRTAFYDLVDAAITTALNAGGVEVYPAHWSAHIGATPAQRAITAMKDDDATPTGGRLVSYWSPKAAA